MLTADQLDILPNAYVELWQEFEQSVINDMARRLANLSYDSAAWQAQRLIESGKLYETVLAELAAKTGQSEAVLREIFEKAGVQSLRFDDKIYTAAGLSPNPLNQSPAVLAVLQAEYNKTNGILQNLVRTTALSSQRDFLKASDMAYLQVRTGAMSYDQAIRAAIKSIGDSGLSVFYPSGHTDKLDVAMRRNVLTGVSQTAGKMQEARANEMGADLVQVSAHIGARPLHQEWQGQIYSRSGTHGKYPDFVSSTGYGTGAGLGGWNCRHSWYPFFAGISNNAYTEADRQSFANRSVTHNGKEISVYEATQRQRYIERQIRKWKRQASALDAAGTDNAPELAKVREWQARARDLVKQTGLNRQYVREQI